MTLLVATAVCCSALRGGSAVEEIDGGRAHPVEARPHGHFDLLTYNVAGLPAGISQAYPADAAPRISTRLNRYDVVLLQEDFCFHEFLVERAQHAYRTVPQQILGALVNDGLNALSTYPIAGLDRERWASAHGVLSSYCDRLATKGFAVARVRVAEGVEIAVVNLHADAGYEDGDRDARARQFEQLADHLNGLASDVPVIVGGDYNLEPHDPRDREILESFYARTGLIDAAWSLGIDDPEIDRYSFRSGGCASLRAVDWRIADEFVDPDGVALSDHPAVHVRFEWHRRAGLANGALVASNDRGVSR